MISLRVTRRQVLWIVILAILIWPILTVAVLLLTVFGNSADATRALLGHEVVYVESDQEIWIGTLEAADLCWEGDLVGFVGMQIRINGFMCNAATGISPRTQLTRRLSPWSVSRIGVCDGVSFEPHMNSAYAPRKEVEEEVVVDF